MPSKTKRQHRKMAVEAKRPGGDVPQNVAKEYLRKDRGKAVAKKRAEKRSD